VSRPGGLWPAAAFAVCAVAAIAGFWGALEPVRPYVVLPFLLVAPGLALVRLLRLGDLATELAVAIGLSLAVNGLAAGIMAYAGAWSAGGTLAAALTATSVAAGVEVAGPAASWRRGAS